MPSEKGRLHFNLRTLKADQSAFSKTIAAIVAIVVVVAAIAAALVLVGGNNPTNFTVPDAPTGLTATPSNAQVSLSWTAPVNNGGRVIDYYVVYQDGVALVAHATGTTAIITSLSNGHQYNFTVAAHNLAGISAQSSTFSSIPCTVPDAPTGLTAIPDNAQVILNWTMPAVNGGSTITGYKLYRSTTTGGTYVLIASPLDLTYTNIGLTNDQTYWYEVSAVNAQGEGAKSPSVSSTPHITEVTISNCLLFYDPTGTNYKLISESETYQGMTTNSIVSTAFIVENYTSDPSVKMVTFTSDHPISQVGNALLEQSVNGALSLETFTQSSIITTSQSAIVSTASSLDNHNVELDLNAIGVVYGDHTFALGLGQDGHDFIIISPQKMPMFFTDVHVHGIIVKPSVLATLGFLNFDVNADLQKFIQIGILTLLDNTEILLADHISYKTTKVVVGDVHELIRPEEIVSLADKLSGPETDSTGSDFLMNMAKNVDEVLIMMGERQNTILNSNLWFILGTRGMTYDEMTGIVNMKVAESNFSAVLSRLGIDFQVSFDNSILNWNFHIGVTNETSPLASSIYQKCEVRGLKPLLQPAHQYPQVASVDVNGFALVLDYKNLIKYIGSALDPDQQSMDQLKALAGFRNPAFALMLDRNYTDVFDVTSGNNNFWGYGAIVILRNVTSTEGMMQYISVKGVLFDTWKYLGIVPLIGLEGLPLILADSSSNVTSGVFTGSLSEISSLQTDQQIVVVHTQGYAVGTTLKTVGIPILNLLLLGDIVKYIPVDCGIYSLHDTTTDIVYHVPMFYPGWYPGYQLGPTYLGEKVNITAMYIRGEPQREQLASFLTSLTGQNVLAQQFNGFIEGINRLENVQMLDGYFLVMSIEKSPSSASFELTNISYSKATFDNGDLTVKPQVTVNSQGTWTDFSGIKVRFIVTAPNGSAYSKDAVSIAWGTSTTDVKLWPYSIVIDNAAYGIYKVSAYLMLFNGLGFGESLASTSYTFNISQNPIPTFIGIWGPLSAMEAGSQFNILIGVYDSNWNLIINYDGTIGLLSSDAGADLPTNHTFVPSDGGSFPFTGAILTTSGIQTISANIAGLTEPTGILFVVITPNMNMYTWVISKISGDGQTIPSSSTLEPLIVQVVDQYGNGIGGWQIDWKDNLNPFSLPFLTTTTNEDGQSQALISLPGPGSYTLYAFIHNSPIPLSVTFTETAT